MFPASLMKVLVFGLALLIVAFAVVMGGYALVLNTSDGPDPIGDVFYGVGVGLLVLATINVLLLLIALGVNELGRRE